MHVKLVTNIYISVLSVCNVFYCLPICFLLFPHNVQLHQLHPGSSGPAVVFHYRLITGNYLSSQLCPLALTFEIVMAAVGLQSWVNELSIQDAEHQVAEVTSW